MATGVPPVLTVATAVSNNTGVQWSVRFNNGTAGKAGTLFLVFLSMPNGTSVVAPGYPWVLVMNSPYSDGGIWGMIGNGDATDVTYYWNWTTQSSVSSIYCEVTGANVGPSIYDAAVSTGNASTTTILTGSCTPVNPSDLMLCFYTSRYNGDITVPTRQTNATNSRVAASVSPATLPTSCALGWENMSRGVNVTAVSAANPAVFSVPSTSGLTVGDTVTWGDFTGTDAAFLNTTNPSGVVTALSANVSFTIGALNTTGKTFTWSQGTNPKAQWNGCPLGNAATVARTATGASAAQVEGYQLLIAPSMSGGGVLMPAGQLALPEYVKNVVGADSSHAAAVTGAGSASAQKRIYQQSAFGQFFGGVPFIGASPPNAGALVNGYSGSYKVTGTVYDGVDKAQKRVFLTPRNAQSLIIADQFSDPTTGIYLFENLAPGTYDVWGIDQNNVENDAWQAMVVATSM